MDDILEKIIEITAEQLDIRPGHNHSGTPRSSRIWTLTLWMLLNL